MKKECFKTLGNRKFTTMILERRETNKVSPETTLAFFLDKMTRWQGRGGKSLMVILSWGDRDHSLARQRQVRMYSIGYQRAGSAKRKWKEREIEIQNFQPWRFWLSINLIIVEARQRQLLRKENLMGTLNQTFHRVQMGLRIIWVHTIQSGENLIE